MPKIEGLYSYPIKSCRGVELDKVSVDDRGLAYDREWMLADSEGTFLSQRKTPELALVQPLVDAARRMLIHAPGMSELSIDLEDTDHEPVRASVWGDTAPAIAQAPEADVWFRDYLGRDDVRLVRRDPHVKRLVDDVRRRDGATNTVGFADGAPLLLTTTASLDAVNEIIERQGAKPVPMDRFRPNIVVGPGEGENMTAFEEDFWREVYVGGLDMFVAWACARCAIPDTDQATGSRGKQVLRALSSFRRGVDIYDPTNTGVFFGQNLLHIPREGATLSVDDEVTVLQRAAERNITGIS